MVVGSPIALNLVPSGVMPIVYLNQTDKGYDKEFLIYNGSTPYNVPEGVSATIRGKKGDQNGIVENATVTAGSNKVTVTITQQMTAVAGNKNIFELVFVDTAGLRVGTVNMVFAVQADAMDDAAISDSDIGYAEQVLTELQSVQAVNNQVQQNKSNLAAEITRATTAENSIQSNLSAEVSARIAADAAMTARVDNLVVTAGGSDITEVVDARTGQDGTAYGTLKTRIDSEVGNLNSQLSQLITDTIGEIKTEIALTQGTRVTSATTKNVIEQVAATGYQSAVIPCAYGDIFDVYCNTQSTSYEAYGFYSYDESTGKYSRHLHSTGSDGVVRITPNNQADTVLIINNNSSYIAAPKVYKVTVNAESLKSEVDSLAAIVAKNLNHICFLRRGLTYRPLRKEIYIPAQQYIFDGKRKTVAAVTVNVSAFDNYYAVIYNNDTDAITATSGNFTLTDEQYLIGAFDARVPEAGFVFGQYTIGGFVREYGVNHATNEGLENVASDWWIYPFAIRYHGMRDRIYVGYIDSDKVCGVIAIDKANGQIQRRNLYISDVADEHNAPSVSILPDGKIMVICTNHATSPYHTVYISKKPESVADFTSYTLQTSHDGVTYSQVVKMGTTYYLFYRAHDYVEGSTTTDKYHWCVRTSTDGLTWSDEVTWLTGGTVQYYMLARQYDSTHIKVYMQGNASGSYTDIRLCYIDTTSGDILDTDMSTVLGNLGTLAEPISYESFTVILAKTSTYKNRLLSAAPGTDLSFVCGRIASASNYSVYLYRQTDSGFSANSIPDMGASFGGSSNSTYINHAEIVAVDNGTYTVVSAANTGNGWELRKYAVTSAGAGSATVIKATAAAVKLIRPFRVVDDDTVIATKGTWADYDEYYEDFLIADVL